MIFMTKIEKSRVTLVAALLIGILLTSGCTKRIHIQTTTISAGTFTMGCTKNEKGCYENEAKHQVTVSAFKMSQHEITNAAFAKFLNTKGVGRDGKYAAGSYPTQTLICTSSGIQDWGLHYINDQWVPAAGFENHPVVFVSWYGAAEFATYVGGRLPTEAEWEYACRAGTSTPFSTGYCLSSTQANYDCKYPYDSCSNTNTTASYTKSPQPVGSYPPNRWGLYDMHGNVWEWCGDWYKSYGIAEQIDPTGPAEATALASKVLRGSSWIFSATYSRSARRDYRSPSGSGDDIGFRVVFPLSEKIGNESKKKGQKVISGSFYVCYNSPLTAFTTSKMLWEISPLDAWIFTSGISRWFLATYSASHSAQSTVLFST